MSTLTNLHDLHPFFFLKQKFQWLEWLGADPASSISGEANDNHGLMSQRLDERQEHCKSLEVCRIRSQMGIGYGMLEIFGHLLLNTGHCLLLLNLFGFVGC